MVRPSSGVSEGSRDQACPLEKGRAGGIVLEAGGADVFWMGRTGARGWKFQEKDLDSVPFSPAPAVDIGDV